MESANSTIGKMEIKTVGNTENSSASEEMKISEKETSKSGNQLLQLKMKIIQLLDQKAYHSLTYNFCTRNSSLTFNVVKSDVQDEGCSVKHASPMDGGNARQRRRAKRKLGRAPKEKHISSGNGSEESLLKESAPAPQVINAVSSSTIKKNKENNGFPELQNIGIKQEPENKSFKSSLDTPVKKGAILYDFFRDESARIPGVSNYISTAKVNTEEMQRKPDIFPASLAGLAAPSGRPSLECKKIEQKVKIVQKVRRIEQKASEQKKQEKKDKKPAMNWKKEQQIFCFLCKNYNNTIHFCKQKQTWLSIDYFNKVVLRGKERFLVDPQEEHENEIGSMGICYYKTKYDMDKDLMYEADEDGKKRELWDEEYRKIEEIEKRKLELEKEQEKEKAEERRKKAEKERKRINLTKWEELSLDELKIKYGSNDQNKF